MPRKGDTFKVEVRTKYESFCDGEYNFHARVVCPVCGQTVNTYLNEDREEWPEDTFTCGGCKNGFVVLGYASGDYEDDFINIQIDGITVIDKNAVITGLALVNESGPAQVCDYINRFRYYAHDYDSGERRYRLELTIKEI